MSSRKTGYKDMEKYAKYIKRNRQKNYERGREGSVRHNWTNKEIEFIMNKNGLTDREISQKIHHSVQAIQVKRAKLKRTEGKKVIDKAINYIKEKQKIQYKYALSQIECDDLLKILKGELK